MKIRFTGDWKSWLILGGIFFLLLFFLGAVVTSIFGLFVWLLKGFGTIVGAVVKFAFSSVFSFAAVVALAYLVYRFYLYLNDSSTNDTPETVEYSDEDFER